jgi:hypothetical protein
MENDHAQRIWTSLFNNKALELMPILKKRIVVHCILVYKLKYNTNDCIEWYLWCLQVRMFIKSNTVAFFPTPLWIIMCLESKLSCALWKGTQTYDSYVIYLSDFLKLFENYFLTPNGGLLNMHDLRHNHTLKINKCTHHDHSL